MNPHSKQDTDNLLPLLKSGDMKAFEIIYDLYADNLFRYIYSRVRIKEISEEIIQEIFVSLWTKRETLVITSSLESYLYGAAKYKILSYMRSDKVRKQYAADFTLFVAGRYDNSVEEWTDLTDLQSTVERSIQELPDKCQTAFRLSRMEHLPIPHIAERMNISTRTVENYLSQALRHLRTSLGEFLALAIPFTVFF